MRKKPDKSAKGQRYLLILLNGILFLINFLIFYTALFAFLPGLEGLWRVLAAWVPAYIVTWILVRLTRGVGRLWLTLGFLLMLALVYLVR